MTNKEYKQAEGISRSESYSNERSMLNYKRLGEQTNEIK